MIKLNKYIEHTNLNSFSTIDDIEKLCLEAIRYKFKAVCVSPYYVKFAKQILKKYDIIVCTVIGFPLGSNLIETKVVEAIKAVSDGADEIDMVINISALKNREYDYIYDEINAVVDSVQDKCVKVIVETCFLNEKEKEKICNIVLRSNAKYIKTSTGYGKEGANVSDIILFNKILNKNKKIKASGGIKTKEQAISMINAGASRIGTSSGVKIIK